jgi:inosose dehydratase
MNRRDFLITIGATTTAIAHSRWLPSRPPAHIRFGCAAITWNTANRQAIDDIAALHFRGIQLLAAQAAEWHEKPAELKELLAAKGLTFVAFSSGTVGLDPATHDATIAMHTANARFVQAAGGNYLQVTDTRPTGRAPTPDECRQMGVILTEIGRRTADVGIALGYHNHMGALGQSPEEVARVLDAADPRFVKLELDVAHYYQAGGDPAKAVRDNKGRLLFLHIKDVERLDDKGGYRFVELGRGVIDLPALFAALEATDYNGWAVVELDSVPDKARTPKDANAISKAYLEKLGYDVAADGAPKRPSR